MENKKPLNDYEGTKSLPSRLQMLVRAWQELNKTPLKHRKKMLLNWASGYFKEGYSRNHPFNLIDRGVSTIVPFLIEGNPRILVETAIPNVRPWAYTTQLAINFFIEKLNLAENVFIPAAINSMFGAAITRTSFYYDRLISLDDEVIKVGTPWVELIDDSNYIGDPSAKRRCDFTFEGDIYVLPTEYAKDFFAGKDKYGNQIADYITSDGKLTQKFSPKEIWQPNFDRTRLSLREYTTFIDIYLRDENTIITIMPEGKKSKILREEEWDGPPGGPYDYLGYKFFPDSSLALPPAWSWNDVDITMNILAEKMQEQAEAQKDLVAYSAEASEDMDKLSKAPNLGTVKVADVNAMQKISFGGVNPVNFQWVGYIEEQFTKQGGNPDVLGGRGAQAPTLGQEQLIYSNATRIVNNMYTRWQAFVSSVVKKLAWAFWTDPTVYVPVIKEIPGAGELPAIFSQAEKVGDFYDFIFKIVPYSTQRNSPEVRYQKLMQFLSQWILPTMQLAAAQGQQIDFNLVSKILADYAGIESFNQWYKSAIPEGLQGTSVDYKMLPIGDQKRKSPGQVGKSPGQTNDTFGVLESSREANKNQQQKRTGGGLGGA